MSDQTFKTRAVLNHSIKDCELDNQVTYLVVCGTGMTKVVGDLNW